MGIVVKFYNGPENSPSEDDGEIWFYQKGADTVMTSIVAANDWLDEETANMAREGLRTLVVGRKKLSAEIYQEFSSKHAQASLALHNRDHAVAEVVKKYLENDLELLGVTGVEDKLQKDVKPSLELLRNAGIKIWMLTGDKVETARCVAVSSKLVARGQYVHTIAKSKLAPAPRHDIVADLSSETQGPRPRFSRLSTQQTGCLSSHRWRVFGPHAYPLPRRVRLSGRAPANRSSMPLLAYSKSRRCQAHPLLHTKACLLYR
jgi:phospholipid-translocating ATPase